MEEVYDIISIARNVKRPAAEDFIEAIFDGFTSFHGDRYFGDDNAVIGGIATLSGIPVTVIGIQKGNTIAENVERNFGCAHPEGYRKALRLMKQAEKFKRPIINFIDTPGAFCGIEAEERGQGEAIARNLYEMSSLKTPIISIILGEGGSGGALALAVADEVWMLENSIYSILSPEGFASILWKDSKRAGEAAKIMKLTAHDLLELKVIEKIIPEETGGAHNNIQISTEKIEENLMIKIKEFMEMDQQDLIEKRYNRFRKFGDFVLN